MSFLCRYEHLISQPYFTCKGNTLFRCHHWSHSPMSHEGNFQSIVTFRFGLMCVTVITQLKQTLKKDKTATILLHLVIVVVKYCRMKAVKERLWVWVKYSISFGYFSLNRSSLTQNEMVGLSWWTGIRNGCRVFWVKGWSLPPPTNSILPLFLKLKSEIPLYAREISSCLPMST